MGGAMHAPARSRSERFDPLDRDPCPICFEKMTGAGPHRARRLSKLCRHSVCAQCYECYGRTIRKFHKCPVCRTEILRVCEKIQLLPKCTALRKREARSNCSGHYRTFTFCAMPTLRDLSGSLWDLFATLCADAARDAPDALESYVTAALESYVTVTNWEYPPKNCGRPMKRAVRAPGDTAPREDEAVADVLVAHRDLPDRRWPRYKVEFACVKNSSIKDLVRAVRTAMCADDAERGKWLGLLAKYNMVKISKPAQGCARWVGLSKDERAAIGDIV